MRSPEGTEGGGGSGGEGGDGGNAGGTEPPKVGTPEWVATLPEDVQVQYTGAQRAAAQERAARKALEAKVAAFESEKAEAARQAAEAKGEFESLYKTEAQRAEDLKAQLVEYKTRETERRERMTARNAERIDKLPEAVKVLLPSYQDPDEMAAWLDKAAATTQTAAAGTKTRGKAGEEPIPPECEAEARKYGKEPRYWFETVWKARKSKQT